VRNGIEKDAPACERTDNMERPQGKFIVFEGIEGAGKTTQIASLAAALQARGLQILVTREPGGSALGIELRRLAMHFREPTPVPIAELLLYLADRAQHIAEVIRPAMAAGTHVICDRFSASTIVYQGFARGLDVELVTRLDALVRGGLAPDLTVVLDCPVDLGLGRARGSDRFHEEQRGFHERVRRGFRALAAQAPERHVVVDSTDPVEIVETQVIDRVLRCLA